MLSPVQWTLSKIRISPFFRHSCSHRIHLDHWHLSPGSQVGLPPASLPPASLRRVTRKSSLPHSVPCLKLLMPPPTPRSVSRKETSQEKAPTCSPELLHQRFSSPPSVRTPLPASSSRLQFRKAPSRPSRCSDLPSPFPSLHSLTCHAGRHRLQEAFPASLPLRSLDWGPDWLPRSPALPPRPVCLHVCLPITFHSPAHNHA